MHNIKLQAITSLHNNTALGMELPGLVWLTSPKTDNEKLRMSVLQKPYLFFSLIVRK